MKKFALIGTDIQQSGSPRLFKAAYHGKYPYELLDGAQFGPLYEKFLKEYTAVNVTAPFKEQALAAADSATDAAQLCGAANMLVKLPDGRVEADNSDFEGVAISLMSAYAVADVDVEDEDAFAEYLEDKSALIVGCGGAGKAAAAAAVSLGYGKVVLMNRSMEKAEALKEHFCEFFGDDLDPGDIEVAPLENLAGEFAAADLVIYNLPCPIDALEEVDASSLGKDKFILEANYKTPYLEKFKDKCTYISGLNWLYNQAVVAYEVFTGAQPDEEEMKKSLNY